MKLSIIIPVYNVEEYIEKCILSLEDQDIPGDEYEIIIINDGSPDNSRDVVLKLMKTFSNIVFIEQENKGVSMARNAGINKATGDYLIFIDPDDYVEVNSFGRIVKAADEQQAQITFLGYRYLNANGTIKKDILFPNERGKLYPGIIAYHVSRGDGTVDPDRSVGILYNRDFISKTNSRYISNMPYLEDGEFLARTLCLAESCIFECNPFYIRTTRPGSATNSDLFFSDRAIKGFIIGAESLFVFQQSNSLTASQKEFLNQPICKFVLLAAHSSLKNKGAFKLKKVRAELKSKRLLKCDLKGCNKEYSRDGFFFNLSPYIYAVYKPVWSWIDYVWFKLFKVHFLGSNNVYAK